MGAIYYWEKLSLENYPKLILRGLLLRIFGTPIELNKNATDENLESKAIRGL